MRMSKLTFQTLEPIKLPLVTRIYKAHYPSAKAKKNEVTIVGYENNMIVAVVRFRPLEQLQLLTGMLVVPTHRGTGVGHQLMNHCRNTILNERTYCFAYAHLETFYQQHGFHTIDSEVLPHHLKQLFNRCINGGKSLIPMHFQQQNP